jgi:hypothetical protein
MNRDLSVATFDLDNRGQSQSMKQSVVSLHSLAKRYN